MKEVEPLNREQDQYLRMAARGGLCFHIDQFGYMNEHRGWRSENRPATDEELAMWHMIFPDAPRWKPGVCPTDIPALDAIPEEFEACLIGKNPITLNIDDYIALSHMKEFHPLTEFNGNNMGHFDQNDNYSSMDIYISELIPKGYYYYGTIDMAEYEKNPLMMEIEIGGELRVLQV